MGFGSAGRARYLGQVSWDCLWSCSEDLVGRGASLGGGRQAEGVLGAVSWAARWPPQGGTWTLIAREGSATVPGVT